MFKIPPNGPITFLTKKQFHSQNSDLKHVTLDDIEQLRLGMYVEPTGQEPNLVGSVILFCGRRASLSRVMDEGTCSGDVYVYNDDRDITLQDIHDLFFKERNQPILIDSAPKWVVANIKYEIARITNTNLNLKKYCWRLFEIYKVFEERLPNENTNKRLFRERNQ